MRSAWSSSEVTQTLSILGQARAASMDQTRSGLPQSSLVFFPGKPLEPARAGTTATTRLFVIVVLSALGEAGVIGDPGASAHVEDLERLAAVHVLASLEEALEIHFTVIERLAARALEHLGGVVELEHVVV